MLLYAPAWAAEVGTAGDNSPGGPQRRQSMVDHPHTTVRGEEHLQFAAICG